MQRGDNTTHQFTPVEVSALAIDTDGAGSTVSIRSLAGLQSNRSGDAGDDTPSRKNPTKTSAPRCSNHRVTRAASDNFEKTTNRFDRVFSNLVELNLFVRGLQIVDTCREIRHYISPIQLLMEILLSFAIIMCYQSDVKGLLGRCLMRCWLGGIPMRLAFYGALIASTALPSSRAEAQVDLMPLGVFINVCQSLQGGPLAVTPSNLMLFAGCQSFFEGVISQFAETVPSSCSVSLSRAEMESIYSKAQSKWNSFEAAIASQQTDPNSVAESPANIIVNFLVGRSENCA
jgi:hypothetical protein